MIFLKICDILYDVYLCVIGGVFVKVLTVGDVCGAAGCRAALRLIPRLKREYGIDFTIVNGENSAVGNGITPESADMLFSAGADVITGGNHTLRRREIHPMLDENPFLLRPDNIPAEYGSGLCVIDLGRCMAAVINLSGQIYLAEQKAENPFEAADRLIELAKNQGVGPIFVDFHAEATSEKRAMGFYLDGRVSAVFGTHTHVLTADAQVLPNGTGYITDIGMTGAQQSVLGVKKDIIINRLKSGATDKFEQDEGSAVLMGCIFDIDPSGKTRSAETIYIKENSR